MEKDPVSQNDRTWFAVAHLAPLIGYIVLIGQILLPLAILLWGPKGAFVQANAKESLNAQVSYTVYGLALLLLLAITVVGPILVVPLVVPLALILVAVVWNMVAAALAANRGEVYRYRLIFRLVA